MSNFLAVVEDQVPIECKSMIKHISDNYPALKRDSMNFYKSHSQFMQFTLDVTCLTPIRSLKHILAEIEKTKMAIEEAQFGIRKKQISIKMKQEAGLKLSGLSSALAVVEIEELESQVANTSDYMFGAIRKLSSFVTQYAAVLKSIGKMQITEQDYEDDEERYHIMTAFAQALHAARSHGGTIDEGNHTYLFQLGIDGTQAQAEVTNYLVSCIELLKSGKAPTHENVMKWLEALADKFSGSAKAYLTRRGMIILDEGSLTKGNTCG